jgi:hypothetical protein
VYRRARFSRYLIVLLGFLLSVLPVTGLAQAAISNRATLSSAKKRHESKASRRSPRISAKSLRARHLSKIFVASADLRPMALQLMENRSPAAYAGVERYARLKSSAEVAPLAWLALGYAHILDHQPTLAIPDLKRAQAHAGELGDYVDYFLGDAQQAGGDGASALKTLEGFDDRYPVSLFIRDAAVVRAYALLARRDPSAAITTLEAHRSPTRADIELAMGHAEALAGNTQTAAAEFRKIFYELPLSPEAAGAQAELQKLAQQGTLAPVPFETRKKRADVLVQNHRADDAVDESRAASDRFTGGAPPIGCRSGRRAVTYRALK